MTGEALTARIQRARDTATGRGLRMSECLALAHSTSHLDSECSYTLTDEHDTRLPAGAPMSLDHVETYLRTVGDLDVWDAMEGP